MTKRKERRTGERKGVEGEREREEIGRRGKEEGDGREGKGEGRAYNLFFFFKNY